MKNIVRLLLLIAILHTPNIMPSQEPNRPQKRSAGAAELDESESAKKQKTEAEGLPAVAAASLSLAPVQENNDNPHKRSAGAAELDESESAKRQKTEGEGLPAAAAASLSLAPVQENNDTIYLSDSKNPAHEKLIRDVLDNDLDAVVEHLDQYPDDINVIDCEQRTLLMVVFMGDAEDDGLINELIDRASLETLNKQDINGDTVLMYAVRRYVTDSPETLIAKGVDVNIKNNNGQTALMFAAASFYNNHPYLEPLLNAPNIDINSVDEDGDTALDYLIQKFSPDYIDDYFGNDEIDWEDENFRDGMLDAVKLFLSKGATFNINNEGIQGLINMALAKGEYDILKAFLEADEQTILVLNNINQLDINIIQGLVNMALAKGDYAILKAFLQADKQNILVLDNINQLYEYGETLLMRACQKGDLNFIKLLLQRGANINAKNVINQTPLMRASQYFKTDAIKLLLTYPHIDINAVDNYGNTALIYLISNLYQDWHERLNENDYGIDINKPENMTQAVKTIKLLIDHGADVNVSIAKPLLIITESGIYELVKALVMAGADTSVKTPDGYTAIDIARMELEAEIKGKNEAADAITKRKHDQRIHTYRKIVQLLSDISEYTPERMDTVRKELIKHKIPKVLIPIISQYLTGQNNIDLIFINDIKAALQSDDTEQLILLLNKEISAPFTTDEDDNTPLTLATEWEKPVAVEIIAKIINTNIENEITKYDEIITRIRKPIKEVRPKEIVPLNDDQKEALKEGIYEANDILKRKTTALDKLSDEELAQLYNQRLEEVKALCEKGIREYEQHKRELIARKEKEFDKALKLAHALGNQEIITMLEHYIQPDVPMDESPVITPIEPLVLIPNEFVQDLIVGDKNSYENVEHHLANYPQWLNGVDKKYGNTPLIIAAEHANDIMVATLLEMGANRHARNNAGKTALDMATESLAMANEPAKRQRLEHIRAMLMQQP